MNKMRHIQPSKQENGKNSAKMAPRAARFQNNSYLRPIFKPYRAYALCKPHIILSGGGEMLSAPSIYWLGKNDFYVLAAMGL